MLCLHLIAYTAPIVSSNLVLLCLKDVMMEIESMEMDVEGVRLNPDGTALGNLLFALKFVETRFRQFLKLVIMVTLLDA